MTNRFSSRWLRTAFVGLSLALLGALMLFASPHGAEAAKTTKEKCASNGAVTDAANNPGLVSDCAALLNAKDTLRGSATLNWSASLTMSSWVGVTLGGSPHRVTGLNLAGKGLSGRIPKQLGKLTELRGLWLYSNELSGRIPRQLGNLSNLKYLALSSNNLSGKIPPQLGRLSKLEDLLLGDNNLSGSIPKQLGKLTNLKRLILYFNELSGEIPPELSKLKKLHFVLLRENKLSGSIPSELGKMPSLTVLELYLNNLTGCVPETLRDLRNDHYFGHTAMYGPIEGIPGWVHNGVSYAKLPWCSEGK